MSRTISLVKTESLSSRIRNASGTLGLWFLLYGCAEILRMIVLSIHQLFWVYSAIRSIKAFRDYLYMHIILIVVLEIIIALIIINLGSKSRNWGSVLNDNLVKKTGLPIIVHGTVRVINSLYILINMNTIINIAVNQSVNPDYELSFEEAYIVVISSYLDMLTLILGLVAFAFLGYVLIFTSEHFDEFKELKLAGILFLVGALLLLTSLRGLIILVASLLVGRKLRKVLIKEEPKLAIPTLPEY